MDYPAYVPTAVRVHITALIEGDEVAPGWAASLASAEQQLSDIERATEDAPPQPGELRYVRRQQMVEHRDMLADIVGCLQRLAHDSRMREAFALLTHEVSDDEQWCGFIDAAWKARMDYGPYRERLKRAAELKEEIADAAQKLADLIREFSETGVNGPGEFYSIPTLLRETDNHGMRVGSLEMWRAMRRLVLGDAPEREIQQPQETGARKIEIRALGLNERPEIDPVEAARNAVRYAWEQAPPLSALLGTVAKAALDFTPSEYGMIGAAIPTRQRSVKTEYLRAFGHVLTDSHYFKLTTAVMNAMAIVANVALNLSEVDVTSDDVRKALGKLG